MKEVGTNVQGLKTVNTSIVGVSMCQYCRAKLGQTNLEILYNTTAPASKSETFISKYQEEETPVNAQRCRKAGKEKVKPV